MPSFDNLFAESKDRLIEERKAFFESVRKDVRLFLKESGV